MFQFLLIIISMVTMVTSSLFSQDIFDIVIRQGFVIDGSGSVGKIQDIGIRNGRVTALGSLESRQAKRIVSAEGLFVTPGFIDMMGETSVPLLRDPESAESKLRQGITTMLVGEGFTVAPQDKQSSRTQWETFAEYFQILENKGIPLNVVHTVGASTVRIMVLGTGDSDPTSEQILQMQELVAQAMEDGAAGVASALIYPPGAYAKTDELIVLCRTAADYGGVYFTHIRNEGNRVLEALDEAIGIGREACIPVHIYHLKAAGQNNWPLMSRILNRMDEARSQGVRITADIYPYVRAGLSLRSFIHPRHSARGWGALTQRMKEPGHCRVIRQEMELDSNWENYFHYAGKDWNNVLVKGLGGGGDPDWVGLSVRQIADRQTMDVWDVFFDLVRKGASVAPKIMNEEQKHLALRDAFICFGCDAAPANPRRASNTHPRAFGTFPRILSKYVREERIIRVEEAIRKMTSLPADILHLEQRGRIRVGDYADLVIFHPGKLEDMATLSRPLQNARGVNFLLINGEMVIDDGRLTDALPGMVLRQCKEIIK
jgi:N-acyl-D-amino-acid deacylase